MSGITATAAAAAVAGSAAPACSHRPPSAVRDGGGASMLTPSESSSASFPQATPLPSSTSLFPRPLLLTTASRSLHQPSQTLSPPQEEDEEELKEENTLLAVLRRCRCEEKKKEAQSKIDANRDKKGGSAHRNRHEEDSTLLIDRIQAGTASLEDAFRIEHHLREALKDDMQLIADALVAADWETIAHLFNAAVADVALSKKVPALEGYALPDEEIAAMARDVGHPLRQLVNQISYAEHGAVDVSGLYRQVRHAAYAPPVVVPDAEVAAFAQCLLQQTSALEHALAASATANKTSAAETTPKRPKKTKRARSSSHSTEEETSKDTSTTDALLDIFNQTLKTTVPTCAQWAFTDAMLADVTAAARAVVTVNRYGNTNSTTTDSTTQCAITAAARCVLEALVAANGRILGTITLPAPAVAAGCTDGWKGDEQTGFVRWFTHYHCENTVYVRAVYEELWAQLSDPQRSFGWDLPGHSSPVLVLVGSEGIGKSWALNYLLYKALAEDFNISAGTGPTAAETAPAAGRRRLVMLLTIQGFWAFLPDERGTVLEFCKTSCKTLGGPPQQLIERLVQEYAPLPSAPSPRRSFGGGEEGCSSSSSPPALLLYDSLLCSSRRGFQSQAAVFLPGAMAIPNMITVLTQQPLTQSSDPRNNNDPPNWLNVSALVAHRVVETFYMPPLGEHEFKAFFKGHFAVERALDKIKQEKIRNDFLNKKTVTGEANGEAAAAKEEAEGEGDEKEKAAAADALVAETFATFGGVLRGAFDPMAQRDVLAAVNRLGRAAGAQRGHRCFHGHTPHEVVNVVPTAPPITFAAPSRRGGAAAADPNYYPPHQP